ncbi:hypothetical protein CKN73_09115 [Carnobacterium divergens]|uniref:SpaA isopeptide-forming pilin-related protein n=1 Tax=Carnobacterium divergens TaxID=2748 RepID=UPI0010722F64|nr:SpaA isopeptide-forming pilin-related protein [Carnobacterium divergens]TFJ40461.1 hypothetical protein CKN77_09215 [Carnobacterium divergens]TFJ49081.1 hypothetical protein CKN73_09115 [Carnobacterium divergens]TFJ54345.1 hypothetical protein CKN83_09020 [Carnobacterium divergens]TFJ59871.1 hypothetical protein CKN89_09460 [Carnobacterium divergens]TFJ70515.1 hypothetical protein CKN91_09075 [Carnobacterium divergens]
MKQTKLKNKVINSVLTLGMVCGSLLPTTTVFAEGIEKLAPVKHTVSILEKDVTYLKSDVDGFTPVRMVDRLRDENGAIKFCINFDLPSPNGLEYESYEQLDNATTYLMDAYTNGNSNLTGDKAIDEYIVQAAIHNIKSPESFSLDRNFVDDYGILPRIKALKAEALNAPAPSIPVFENKLSFDKASLSFELVGEEYVSDYVVTNLKGNVVSTSKVVENATPNTKLIDENGNEVVSFSDGTKFKMVIPETELEGQALSPSVTAKGSFTNAYNVAVRYGGHAGFQDVASYELKEFSEDKQATVSGEIEAVKGSVKFVKKGTDEKLLDNVQFKILASDGVTVEKEIVTENGEGEASGLAYGVHYLVETGTLNSYVLNGEKIPFTINHNQEVIDLGTIYNKLKTGKIAVHKVDENGKLLANAEFTKTDSEGITEVKTTDETGLVEFGIEANNVYSVEETKNPLGYIGAFLQENITVEDDNQVFEYTVANTLKTGKIIIHKVDENGKALKDAEFTKTDSEGVTEVKTTDEYGLVEFDIEANNIYSVEETKNPLGYTGTFLQENITIEENGQTFEYTVKNTKDKIIEKTIIKETVKTEKSTFPQTGEKANQLVLICGLFVMIAGVSIYLSKKKTTQKNKN